MGEWNIQLTSVLYYYLINLQPSWIQVDWKRLPLGATSKTPVNVAVLAAVRSTLNNMSKIDCSTLIVFGNHPILNTRVERTTFPDLTRRKSQSQPTLPHHQLFFTDASTRNKGKCRNLEAGGCEKKQVLSANLKLILSAILSPGGPS